MATHSSILAWRIPGTGEPGGLPSMGSQRVGHNWSDLAAAAAAIQFALKPLPPIDMVKFLFLISSNGMEVNYTLSLLQMCDFSGCQVVHVLLFRFLSSVWYFFKTSLFFVRFFIYFNATVAFVASFIFMDVSPLGLLCVTDVFLQFYFAIPLALLQILRNRNF